MADVIGTIATAIENRVKAIEAEAAKLLQEGEAEFAKIKTALAEELAKLADEIRSIVSGH